ncbi:MAG: HAD-IIIC family phosphatase [Candidatus Thorarchaeota archaeon]|nr:HAD-IIIC family phosphatase [Candidatus Thorarchaeota archaeon]
MSEKLAKLLGVVRTDPSYLNLWSTYKRIQTMDLPTPDDLNKIVRLAVIGSSTLEPLAACVDVKTRLLGLFPITFVGGFNTYRQEALDPSSPLYAHNADVIILSVDAWSLLGQMFIAEFVRMSSDDRRAAFQKIVDDVASVAEALETKTSSLILVNNFIVPTFTPLGLVDNKQAYGLRDLFREANAQLEERFRATSRVFVVDLDTVAASFGKANVVNWNTYYRGSVPFSEGFTPILADEYLRYIRALKGLTKKCIVLDLDNTLWGGIIGEDGMEGIKLGNTSPGNEFVDFQRALLSLYNRGVILAVNSKNNPDDALQVLREHPYQVLREEHFAALRINWQSKVQNLIELAHEINIGLDSMVFIDDNPVEREQVRQALPEVLVVDLPKNPRLYRATLEDLHVFDVLSLTAEDMRRGEMYVGKRKRAELERSTGSLEDFLKTLDLKVRIKLADDFDTPRVVQLIGKTNQFNLTTRRHTDAEVQQFRKSPDHRVYSLAVRDRFGDEGVVGVAITRAEKTDWIIDTLLMSCRVIGRNIETAFLAKIIADAREAGAKRLVGEYIPTKKNAPAKDLYERHNFTLLGTEGDVTRWALDITEKTIEVPEYIELVEEWP